jgi:membrane-bound metal-dependent hydrolase YbcI (DUF457 family)
MPFTPYHFGPSCFAGLVFRKWLDIPVFVLANVVVDIEVLIMAVFNLGYPVHRYCHTLVIGAVVGAAWGLVAYPLRPVFTRIMSVFRLNYEPTLRKMIISGILGVWFHVLIDALQHPDMKILWPNKTFSLWKLVHPYAAGNRVEHVCVLFFLATIVVYGFIIAPRRSKGPTQKHADRLS